MKVVGKRQSDDDIADDTQAIRKSRENPVLDRADKQLGSVLVASGSSPLINVVGEDVTVRCTH